MNASTTERYVQFRFGHGLGLNNYSASFRSVNYSVAADALAAGGNATIAVRLSARTSAGMPPPARSVLLFLSGDAESASGNKTVLH
jgi:hypothetical protein